MVSKSFVFVGASPFIFITMVLVAELYVVIVRILAEVYFIAAQEILYFAAEGYLLEMTRLSLPH